MNPILLDIPDHFETERLLMRVPQPGEAAITNAAIRESISELGRWLSWANPVQSIEQTEARNRRALAEFMARDYFNFHIYRKDDDLFMGSVSLGPEHWHIPTFVIGYWLRTSLSGNGYMTEAVRGLVQFARQHLKARRLEIFCAAANRASAGVAERAGFTLEAHLHQDFRLPSGQLTDSLLYVWRTDEPDSSQSRGPRPPVNTHPILLDLPDTLQTERLILRPPRAGDGPMVYDVVMASLDNLRLWMPWAHGEYTVDNSESFARISAAAHLRRESLNWRMMHRADNRFIGMVSLFNFDWDIPSGEIGYWLHVDYQGKGYMTEAVNFLTRFGFEELNLERIEIRCNALNASSANVARRCGYRLEAQLRHHRRDVNNQLADTLVFARLPGDGSNGG